MEKHYTLKEKLKMIEEGINLEEFVKDKDCLIRAEIAKQGKCLDKLVNDEHWIVRYTVARQGYGHDILYKDEHWQVRAEVVRQGNHLKFLVNDEHWMVRWEVAQQREFLDVLVNDKNWMVRKEVLNYGYGIEILIKDKNEKIRLRALELENAETHVVARNFGTYKGNLFLYVWKDRYEINSGCYTTDSLDSWYERYVKRIEFDKSGEMCIEQASQLVEKMEKIINAV